MTSLIWFSFCWNYRHQQSSTTTVTEQCHPFHQCRWQKRFDWISTSTNCNHWITRMYESFASCISSQKQTLGILQPRCLYVDLTNVGISGKALSAYSWYKKAPLQRFEKKNLKSTIETEIHINVVENAANLSDSSRPILLLAIININQHHNHNVSVRPHTDIM